MAGLRGSASRGDIRSVGGRGSQKMAPVLRQMYGQMVSYLWLFWLGGRGSPGGMLNY